MKSAQQLKTDAENEVFAATTCGPVCSFWVRSRPWRLPTQRQLAADRPDDLPGPASAQSRGDRAAGAGVDGRGYIAYQRAGSGEEADALAWARALADRKLRRPALDALRLSLDMRE